MTKRRYTLSNSFKFTKEVHFIHVTTNVKMYSVGWYELSSPSLASLIWIHDWLQILLSVILCTVLYVSFKLIAGYSNLSLPLTLKYESHNVALEVTWTLVPCIILCSILFPSLRLLYYLDDILLPTLTIRLEGVQWYWSYQIVNTVFL